MELRVKHSGRDWQQKVFFVAGIFNLFFFASHVFSQASLFDSSFQIGAGANGAVNAILVQQDGKILVGGEFTVIAGQTNAYLARLNSDGQLDASFGSGTDGIVNRLLQLPDGKILVAGEFTNLQGVARHGLGRLLTNGLVDLSFDAGTNIESDEIIRTICLQSDGKIVTASEKIVSYYLLSRFSRFHPDGQLDTSFVRTNTADLSVLALLPLTNGTILAGGSFQQVGTSYSGLALLREDGQVDINFVSLLTNYSTVFSLTELTNGNILVGGLLNLAGLNRREAVAELTPQWQWNADFNADEFQGDLFGGYARSVLVQPDGKIVVAGIFYEVGGYWRRHILRLDAQGHVDPCFDPGLGLGNDYGARALARQSDGRILIGGSFDNTTWIGGANLARLLPESECGVMRAYLINMGAGTAAIGTCPPGGTNLLQMSTNLVDWQTMDTQTVPYVFGVVDTTQPKAFFRVKKVF
jgi:uncharacterized delta-60 repeat protein